MKALYPTYTRVNFDTLIPTPQGIEKVYKGDTVKTVSLMRDMVQKHYPSMKPLAMHLKGNTDVQTFYNIFYFVKSEIKYEYDERGKEQ